MTKEVLISIAGLQHEIAEDEAIEIITAGRYYSKEGKNYVRYEEIVEEEEGTTKVTLMWTEKCVEILKKGINNVHMVFEEGKKNMTYYNTPYGTLMMGLDTLSVDMEGTQEEIILNVRYGLDINYEFVSECKIQIKVHAK